MLHNRGWNVWTGHRELFLYLILLLCSILENLQVGRCHWFVLVPTVLAEGYSTEVGLPFHLRWTSDRCCPGTRHPETSVRIILLVASPNCCFSTATSQCLAETQKQISAAHNTQAGNLQLQQCTLSWKQWVTFHIVTLLRIRVTVLFLVKPSFPTGSERNELRMTAADHRTTLIVWIFVTFLLVGYPDAKTMGPLWKYVTFILKMAETNNSCFSIWLTNTPQLRFSFPSVAWDFLSRLRRYTVICGLLSCWGSTVCIWGTMFTCLSLLEETM